MKKRRKSGFEAECIPNYKRSQMQIIGVLNERTEQAVTWENKRN